MKIRTISGACYVLIIVAFFMLRQFVDYRLMNVLTAFFASLGSFELARALAKFSLKGTKVITTIFGIAFIPFYCLVEYLIAPSLGAISALALSGVMIIAFCIYAIIKRANKIQYITSILGFIYPAVLLLTMALANDNVRFGVDYGFISMLLIFVVAPCADVFAYLVGSLLKGPKLCPKLSPKKTISGAIGGIIGGVVGAIALYFILNPVINFFSPILYFIIIGMVASVLTEVGDLFESFIKRKAGIKDSGKIMPGHGGVLDRIDGMMFASAFIYLMFVII